MDAMTTSGQNIVDHTGTASDMKLSLIFLMIDERPQQLMYVCPVCLHQSFIPATAELGSLPCRRCGVTLNGGDAELEVLGSGTRRRSMDEESHPLMIC
jgi:hypothetical protein